ncbi:MULTISPECIES: hypothetical protein [unclassified Xanthomonas]|uniref:hypothetical protein n=1 Tax=Xanthomonas sp. LMG 8992 TaxID=1591157 RepID=UPI0013721253|nr:hypothetical protein [Xanthomonas sp. LMG 8992]
MRRFLDTINTYIVYDEAATGWATTTPGKALQQAIWLDNLPVSVLTGTTLNYVQPEHVGVSFPVKQAL